MNKESKATDKVNLIDYFKFILSRLGNRQTVINIAIALFIVSMAALASASQTVLTERDLVINSITRINPYVCVVDSTTSYDTLQECINLVGNGGTIYVKNGTELVTSMIKISGKNNLKIIGSGNSILQANGSLTASLFNISDSNNIQIDGMVFDCNNATSNLFEAWRTNGVAIRNNVFKNSEIQSKCYVNFYASDHLEVTDNYFNHVGIINVLDCAASMGCSNNYDTGKNEYNRSTFVRIADNTINNSRDSAISTNAHYVTISGNTIEKTLNATTQPQVGHGIDVFGFGTYVTVSNNVIKNSAATDGIRIQGTAGGEVVEFAHHITIVGNIIDTANRNCIATTGGVYNVNIIGNILNNCSSKAISSTNLSTVTALGNWWAAGDTSDIGGFKALTPAAAVLQGSLYTNKTVQATILQTTNITAKGSNIIVLDDIDFYNGQTLDMYSDAGSTATFQIEADGDIAKMGDFKQSIELTGGQYNVDIQSTGDSYYRVSRSSAAKYGSYVLADALDNKWVIQSRANSGSLFIRDEDKSETIIEIENGTGIQDVKITNAHLDMGAKSIKNAAEVNATNVNAASNLVVVGTSDLQGNVADSGGSVIVADDLVVTGDLNATNVNVSSEVYVGGLLALSKNGTYIVLG